MKYSLWKSLRIAGVAGLVGAGIAVAVATSAAPQTSAAASVNLAQAQPSTALAVMIERGRYVAISGDCIACHSAHGSRQPFAGGLALATPFGKLLASNITQDVKTGIGGWTEAEFTRAVRQGKGKHGEHLYPAMPYNAYVKITDADMHDLWAYMKTIPPVDHEVVSNQLPFPFKLRFLMSFWNILFFDDKPFKGDPAQTAEWNRGAYLAGGLAHCAACHTGKNFLGGDSKAAFAGGMLGSWYAPDITSGTGGLRDWTNAQTVAYLKTGGNVKSMASGPMAEAIENSLQHMRESDLQAIAVYLKSIPGPDAARRPAPLTADTTLMKLGAHVYEVNCAACHSSNGKGLDGLVTALAGNSALQADQHGNLINAILRGTRPAVTLGKPTGAGMPAFAWKLSDDEIAAVATYVRNQWGNAAAPVPASRVAAARKDLSAPAKLRFSTAAN